jgi:hypothetical protein
VFGGQHGPWHQDEHMKAFDFYSLEIGEDYVRVEASDDDSPETYRGVIPLDELERVLVKLNRVLKRW